MTGASRPRIGDVVLIVDIPGGDRRTSPRSKQSEPRDGGLELLTGSPSAIGSSLGGDNMGILALAHVAKAQLEAELHMQLDRTAAPLALMHAARGQGQRDCSRATLRRCRSSCRSPASNSSATRFARRSRATGRRSQSIAPCGLPEVDASEEPARRARTALTQVGRCDAADAAVTRHLASRHLPRCRWAQWPVPRRGLLATYGRAVQWRRPEGGRSGTASFDARTLLAELVRTLALELLWPDLISAGLPRQLLLRARSQGLAPRIRGGTAQATTWAHPRAPPPRCRVRHCPSPRLCVVPTVWVWERREPRTDLPAHGSASRRESQCGLPFLRLQRAPWRCSRRRAHPAETRRSCRSCR